MFFQTLNTFSQTDRYLYKTLSTKDGLSTNDIAAIFQDSRGFVWFGTYGKGICRYDGSEIKIYKHIPGDSTSISGDYVWSDFFEDEKGSIWFCTERNGLNKFDVNTEIFTSFPFDANRTDGQEGTNFRKIYMDKNGIIWIGQGYHPYLVNKSSGLTRFDPQTEKFDVYKQFPDQTQNNADVINEIYEDSKGNLWIGAVNGVYLFDRNTEKFINHYENFNISKKFYPSNVIAIREDCLGNILIANTKGLYLYDPEKEKLSWIYYGDHISFIAPQIFPDPMDAGQTLWMPTVNHIFKYNVYNKTVRPAKKASIDPFYSDREFANGNRLYINESGICWYSAYGESVYQLYLNNTWIEYRQLFPDSIPNNAFAKASSFYEELNGDLWIGTTSSGLKKYDSSGTLIKWFPEFNVYRGGEFQGKSTNNWVVDISRDKDGYLWVGCSISGLNKINTRNDHVSYCRLYDVNGKEVFFNDINDILAEDSLVWMATTKGLFLNRKGIDPDTNFFQIGTEPLDHANIYCIHKDSDGYLWLGTENDGLIKYNANVNGDAYFRHYMYDPDDTSSMISNHIEAIHVTDDGVVWLGTDKGLCRYDKEHDRFIRFTHISNLGDQGIVLIESDKRGNLWMISDKGLLRYNPNAGDDHKGLKVKLFGENDGIPNESLYKFEKANSLYKNRDGRFFIGGEKGYFTFHPDSIQDNTHIPPVYLTSFTVNNKEYELDSSITVVKKINLSYNQNFFSFKFAALDYANPEENQYAYYLEGLEEDWIYSGNRRFASYTDIKPGNYIFRVKGSNNDGYWNEEGTYVYITIAPPFWKTWWAYTVYIIATILILFFLYRYELRRQRLKQSLELEQVEADKLKELDSMKSRFFANISHEFRTPLTLILGPIEKVRKLVAEEGKNDLDLMQRNARRLQTLINQLLNLSKLESGKMKLSAAKLNIVSMVNGYVQSFESLAEKKQIDYSFTCDQHELFVYADKDKLEKILYNLLSNAFKFTDAGGKIEVTISTASPSGIQIKISDTGRGIPTNQLEHIFDRFYQTDDSYSKDQEGSGIGLALTKELVELHHGQLSVESEPGKGTTFYISLLVGSDHLKPEEITESISGSYTEFDEQRIAGLTEDLEKKESPGIKDPDIDDSRPLLLIVEDNDDLRSYIRGCLESSYNLIEATDGELGLQLATEKIPDLIVSDVMMPKMDGMQLSRKIKTDERTSHIPLILLTAKAALEDKLEGLETGADDFLSKPFEVNELLVRIKNLITQRKRLRETFSRGISSPDTLPQKIKDSALSSVDQEFLQKATDMVEANMQDYDFSVEQFSEIMNMNRMQLHRKLKAVVNQSAGDFIRTIRLNRAANLLEAGFGNVTEVTFEVGFNNLSWFTKSFKEQFGVLPSEYKQS